MEIYCHFEKNLKKFIKKFLRFNGLVFRPSLIFPQNCNGNTFFLHQISYMIYNWSLLPRKKTKNKKRKPQVVRG